MGDSYIVLNTWKEEDEEEYQYDLHFWIGKYSTQGRELGGVGPVGVGAPRPISSICFVTKICSSSSTQDEYGTAAYKTVELDTYHKDKPIQHREVQGFESELFQSYFGTIEYLAG